MLVSFTGIHVTVIHCGKRLVISALFTGCGLASLGSGLLGYAMTFTQSINLRLFLFMDEEELRLWHTFNKSSFTDEILPMWKE